MELNISLLTRNLARFVLSIILLTIDFGTVKDDFYRMSLFKHTHNVCRSQRRTADGLPESWQLITLHAGGVSSDIKLSEDAGLTLLTTFSLPRISHNPDTPRSAPIHHTYAMRFPIGAFLTLLFLTFRLFSSCSTHACGSSCGSYCEEMYPPASRKQLMKPPAKII